MKIIFFFTIGLCIHTTYAMQEVLPYNPITDLDLVIQMVQINDTDHIFLPSARSDQAKSELLKKLAQEPFRTDFIIKKEETIIGYLTITKRKAPSKELADELNTKGPEYLRYRKMLLARSNLPATSTGFILRVALIVAKNEQRKGLGKKLMNYAMQEAIRDPEIEAIDLDVATDNLPAVKLYQSLGYQQVAQSPELNLTSFRKNIDR